MKLLVILSIVFLQLTTCNEEEKKPISKNAQIAFRFAENEAVDGYEERELDGKKIYLNPKTEITQKDIDFVIKSHDEYSNMPIVLLEMNPEGTKKFAALTAGNLKKMLAILVNNEILMAPIIQQEITEGKVQITGYFTEEEVDKLLKTLTE
jgi:preprotein translocase subunit SecD